MAQRGGKSRCPLRSRHTSRCPPAGHTRSADADDAGLVLGPAPALRSEPRKQCSRVGERGGRVRDELPARIAAGRSVGPFSTLDPNQLVRGSCSVGAASRSQSHASPVSDAATSGVGRFALPFDVSRAFCCRFADRLDSGWSQLDNQRLAGGEQHSAEHERLDEISSKAYCLLWFGWARGPSPWPLGPVDAGGIQDELALQLSVDGWWLELRLRVCPRYAAAEICCVAGRPRNDFRPFGGGPKPPWLVQLASRLSRRMRPLGRESPEFTRGAERELYGSSLARNARPRSNACVGSRARYATRGPQLLARPPGGTPRRVTTSRSRPRLAPLDEVLTRTIP